MRHKLDQRQARVYGAGSLSVRQDRLSPLHYYALRDPSSVKVRPVDRPPAPDGTRHVALVFGFARETPVKPADAAPGAACDDDADRAMAQGLMTGLPSFVMTVGLPIGHEEAFHQQVVCADPRQTLEELCRRVSEVGRSLR